VSRVIEIQDGQVEVGSLEPLQRLPRRTGLGHLVPFVGQKELQRVQDVDLIVGDEDTDGGNLGHSQQSAGVTCSGATCDVPRAHVRRARALPAVA
jgi:hypothetical protein